MFKTVYNLRDSSLNLVLFSFLYRFGHKNIHCRGVYDVLWEHMLLKYKRKRIVSTFPVETDEFWLSELFTNLNNTTETCKTINTFWWQGIQFILGRRRKNWDFWERYDLLRDYHWREIWITLLFLAEVVLRRHFLFLEYVVLYGVYWKLLSSFQEYPANLENGKSFHSLLSLWIKNHWQILILSAKYRNKTWIFVMIGKTLFEYHKFYFL